MHLRINKTVFKPRLNTNIINLRQSVIDTKSRLKDVSISDNTQRENAKLQEFLAPGKYSDNNFLV